MHKARDVYSKCIRSALAYGASSFHTPTQKGGELATRGITGALGLAQNVSLRIVVGAFESTPIRNLETETWVPPLDLYFNNRLADFETRLQQPALDDGQGGEKTPGSIIYITCIRIYQRFSLERNRRGRPQPLGPQKPTAVEEAAVAIASWAGGAVVTENVVEEALAGEMAEGAGRQSSGEASRAAVRPADDFEHQQQTLFQDKTLKRYEGLTRLRARC